jgi:hypothetical protein
MLLATSAALVAVLAATCGSSASGPSLGAPDATAGATPSPAATAEPANKATPTPLPTPTPRALRLCSSDRASYDARVAQLEADIAEAMRDFDGTWGFSMYDLDCDTWVGVNPEYFEYTASTGKLPFIIAGLRAIQEGRVAFEDLRAQFESVLRVSSDDAANNIMARVSREEVEEVLRIAGVSEQTTWRDSWANYYSTPVDFTRLWTALLRGELLNDEWTDYLLQLSSEAQVPESYETFWSHFDIPGLRFGQKAGYRVWAGSPFHFVGSGYLVPDDGSSEGFAATMVVFTPRDVWDPQRRLVFPLVLDFVEEALAEVR